jgi:hypothetical protein
VNEETLIRQMSDSGPLCPKDKQEIGRDYVASITCRHVPPSGA